MFPMPPLDFFMNNKGVFCAHPNWLPSQCNRITAHACDPKIFWWRRITRIRNDDVGLTKFKSCPSKDWMKIEGKSSKK